jgi:hypothetical protein
LTVHKSAPPLTHQVGAGGGFGRAFNGSSAAPAAPIAPRVINTTQAAADFLKGASSGQPSKRHRYHFCVLDSQHFGNTFPKNARPSG